MNNYISDNELFRRVEVMNKLNEFCKSEQIILEEVKTSFLHCEPLGKLRPTSDFNIWTWQYPDLKEVLS